MCTTDTFEASTHAYIVGNLEFNYFSDRSIKLVVINYLLGLNLFIFGLCKMTIASLKLIRWVKFVHIDI